MCLLNILRWWPMWYLYEWIVLWCCAEMYSIGLGEDWVKAKVANRIICIYNIYIGIQVQQQNPKHTETHLLTWHTKTYTKKYNGARREKTCLAGYIMTEQTRSKQYTYSSTQVSIHYPYMWIVWCGVVIWSVLRKAKASVYSV